MRLSKRHRGGGLAMNMTPMIDIVFQLLIFFMFASQISETNKEPVNLPKLAGEDIEREAAITINVLADGTYVISGRRMGLAEVVDAVSRELAAAPDPARVKVGARPDEASDSSAMNELANALAGLGVKMISPHVEATDR